MGPDAFQQASQGGGAGYGGFGGFGQGGFNGQGFDFGGFDMGDIFDMFTGGSRRQLVALNMEHRFAVGSIGHGGDHPAVPIEVVGGNRARSVGKIRRGGGYIGIERHHHIERVGSKGDPFQNAGILRLVGAHLDQGHKVVAVDADGAECALLVRLAAAIRVIRCALIVGG